MLSIDYIAWQRSYFSTDGIKVIDVTQNAPGIVHRIGTRNMVRHVMLVLRHDYVVCWLRARELLYHSAGF